MESLGCCFIIFFSDFAWYNSPKLMTVHVLWKILSFDFYLRRIKPGKDKFSDQNPGLSLQRVCMREGQKFIFVLTLP
jgi:hypothetical protein